MGTVVASDLHGIAKPRVGLLNIGEEEMKGTAECKRRTAPAGSAPLNYVGFVEGDDIFSGEVDVVVTDGFTGNVALKTMEGLARFICGVMREEYTRIRCASSARSRRRRCCARSARLDPRTYNGASMVGLSGVVIKSHGSADRVSFANAMRVGLIEARKGVPTQIGALLAGACRGRGSGRGRRAI